MCGSYQRIAIFYFSPPKFILSGISEAVKKVEKKIESILKDLVQAILVANSCIWTYEEDRGHFTEFPIRASRVIETQHVVNFVQTVRCSHYYKPSYQRDLGLVKPKRR